MLSDYITSQNNTQEKEKSLHLPFLAIIPYAVRANKNICAECKIFYGELAALSTKYGYCYASTAQLAEMKGIGKRTILRFLSELENESFIKRKTESYSYESPTPENPKRKLWKKHRKIYVGEGFSNNICERDTEHSNKKYEGANPDTFNEGANIGTYNKRTLIENNNPAEPDTPSAVVIPQTIKELQKIHTYRPTGRGLPPPKSKPADLEGEHTYTTYKTTLKNNNPAEPDTPSAVVIPQTLQKLDIPDSLKISICKKYPVQEIETAVQRCLRWKSRPNDEVGVMAPLRRKDTWSDNPTKENTIVSNVELLNSLKFLDEKQIAEAKIVVLSKHIEFITDSHAKIFHIEDPVFRKDVLEYLDKLQSRVKDSSEKPVWNRKDWEKNNEQKEK